MKFTIALFLCLARAEETECVDGALLDAGGDGCDWYYLNDSSCGYWDTSEFKAMEQCCACQNPYQAPADCEDDLSQTDIGGDNCTWYVENWNSCGDWDTENFTSAYMCCACDGGDETCTDDLNYTDIGGDNCAWYYAYKESCGDWDDADFVAAELCCACQ